MIRLNYGCDKRVCYCALIFAADIVPSLSTIQWDLKKPACESTEGAARPLKKKISCQTQKCNFWKRPSTDFDKNYIFGIGTSSAIEWYLSLLLSISWPSDEPCPASGHLVSRCGQGRNLTFLWERPPAPNVWHPRICWESGKIWKDIRIHQDFHGILIIDIMAQLSVNVNILKPENSKIPWKLVWQVIQLVWQKTKLVGQPPHQLYRKLRPW